MEYQTHGVKDAKAAYSVRVAQAVHVAPAVHVAQAVHVAVRDAQTTPTCQITEM